MLRHSRGLPGLRAGLHRILACCGLALLFSASPSFAQSTAVLKKTTQATSVASTSQQTQLEGELEHFHEDYKDKTSRDHYYLRTVAGKRYELKFKEHAPHHLLSGTKVRLKGALSGNVMYLTSGSTSTQVVAAAPSTTTGVQKTAVILVNFQDNATQPVTSAAVQSLVFGTVNNFMMENSSGQTSLSGDVFGWYTIPVSSTTCDTMAIKTYAQSAATAAGANLSGYTRFVYMFPKVAACGFAGGAIVGGQPSDAWINGYFDLRTVAHELGHNLGLEHSHSQNCDLTPIGNTCTTYDYGDVVDTMGGSLSGHFNAYQKEFLGWLNATGVPPITTVQSSGSYVLEPYSASSAGGAKALKILRSTNVATGEKTWYYLEYRQPIGFDSAITGWPGNQLNGVEIHSANITDGSFLLDMTPHSVTTADAWDTFDGALAVGASYSDPAAGLTVTVNWANSTGAGINVMFGNGQTGCTRAKPSVVLSSQSQSVAAGTPVSYTVAVANNDSAGCASSTFNLQGSLPAGWTGTLASPLLSIAPGSASSTTLTATSSTSATAGAYTIGVTATNAASTTYSGIGSASYSVASSGSATTLSTTVATDKSSYSLGSTATITGTVISGGGAVANASVTFTITLPNGSVASQTATTGSTGTAVYKFKIGKPKSAIGTYQVKEVSTSGAQTANATASFTVQ